MGVCNPPNEGEFKTDRRANSFASLAEEGSPVDPPNDGEFSTDRRMGSYPLSESGSPINPPNNTGGDRRGYSSDRQMPVATEPGKGEIPVNPGIAGVTRIGTMPVSVMSGGK